MSDAPDAFVIDPSWRDFATETQRAYLDAVNQHGSRRAAARALGVARSTVDEAIQRIAKTVEREAKPAVIAAPPSGRLTFIPDQGSDPARAEPVARDLRPTRYLLTAAQDNTAVHGPFWANLQAYAHHLRAEIIVGGFTYQKGLFEDHAARSAQFAEAVRPYMRHDDVELSPDLIFAGRMNTLPTAVRPLSGLETYARGRWGIFPHAKVQLVSVPAIQGRHPAHQMTTGACTVANYVEKKAGVKAEFHHTVGATIAEIDADGRIFCRQIIATEDGAFQDLDAVVTNGRVTLGNRVEAITWGDIHFEQIDPEVARAAWGLDIEARAMGAAENMLDALRPRHQFFHDLLDFQARNHHRRGDHHHRFRMAVRGCEKVEDALAGCAWFLRATEREWCTSVVVPSNHNDAFRRWLKEADGREDPTNGLIWLRANTALYEAIERGDDDFDVFRWATARHDDRALADIVFPPRSGSYVICQAAGGIECALHGDEGPNGARGSPTNFTRIATRMNIGHGHSPFILDGVFGAGLCGLLDQGYNSGPSGWAHTQILTYASSKRSLVTFRDGKWRA